MKIYVGVTDSDWFNQLKAENASEVNFWQPSGRTCFQALDTAELFLFKLHKKDGGRICGGGFFVKWQRMSWDLAWNAFGRKNGTTSFTEMYERIISYRKSTGGDLNDPDIGCIILAQTFYFNESDYIDAPSDWRDSIVRGKHYDTTDGIGAELFTKVQDRLWAMHADMLLPARSEDKPLPLRSIGTGMFRLLILDAYKGACAVTGEKTLPALVASHIKPPAAGGENIARNGLLLRADIASLFACGLFTVSANDFRIRVSPLIRERYKDDSAYYNFDGRPISLPEKKDDLPDPELLVWHNKNIFLAGSDKNKSEVCFGENA